MLRRREETEQGAHSLSKHKSRNYGETELGEEDVKFLDLRLSHVIDFWPH